MPTNVPPRMPVTLRINGDDHPVLVEPRRTLLDALRHDLTMTGTKKVCDMGTCGACTVLVDGKAMYACLLLAVDCEGRSVQTIEGLARGEELDPVQRAFIERDAFQCGFCTAGQIMSVRGLLDATPRPTEEQMTQAVTGNLCRCGVYQRIVAAGMYAAQVQAGQSRQSSPPGPPGPSGPPSTTNGGGDDR